ncbi:MAG: GNAT family N-acetyltransferase [Saprospiraceae bacterium]
MQIQPAGPEDIPELLPLINGAYRGEASKKGWTHEADLIAGEARIDDATLRELLQQPTVTMLKHTDAAGQIDACVFLEIKERGLYLGMLTVSPELQGAGLGKQLLAAAEDFARRQGGERIFMNVLSARKELLAWYERHGYRRTGERLPFIVDAKFGVPVQPLDMVILEKMVPAL